MCRIALEEVKKLALLGANTFLLDYGLDMQNCLTGSHKNCPSCVCIKTEENLPCLSTLHMQEERLNMYTP